MVLNSKVLNDLRKDLEQFFTSYEKEKGIKIDLGSISYSDLYAKGSLKIFVKDENHDGEKSEFESAAKVLGISTDVYLKKVLKDGAYYTIKKISLRAKKFPILAYNEDETKVLKLTQESLSKMTLQ